MISRAQMIETYFVVINFRPMPQGAHGNPVTFLSHLIAIIVPCAEGELASCDVSVVTNTGHGNILPLKRSSALKSWV